MTSHARAAAPLHLLELAPSPARPDHAVIATMVRRGASVLDIGCGDGALLNLLAREFGVRGRGFDLDQTNVNTCVVKGLTAVQGDAERDLADFPDAAFDTVILANTIQSLRRPAAVLKQAARIGARIIVSFANYGHWRARLGLLTRGRVSPPPGLSARWCETDNIHPCSVRDFAELAQGMHLAIERAIPLSLGHPGAPFATSRWRANWFADEAVFLLAP